MEKVKLGELNKVEKKIIELNCIQDLIKSANYSIERVNENINYNLDKRDNETATDYDLKELRDLVETKNCWYKLIETLEKLI